MKVFVEVNNYGLKSEEIPSKENRGWYLLADSAVTNTGKPFYVPEYPGEVRVRLSEAVKYNRLGKSISPKFAGRYFSESAPALHFYFPEYGMRLRERGLPDDASRNFDRALFIGDFQPSHSLSIIELKRNGEKVAEFRRDLLRCSIEELTHEISEVNTIKIGDILLPGLSGDVTTAPGDLLEVTLDGNIAFNVRVK